MKKIALAALAALISTPALSADMAVKAPVPNPVYDWTGFYLGATAGAGWERVNVTNNIVNGAPILYNPLDIPTLTAFTSPTMHGTNGIFGARAGYNKQWGAWVLGLEADISSHLTAESNTFGNPFVTFPFGSAGSATSANTSWLATARPRIGYAADRVLVYATGGAAFGQVKFVDAYKAFSPLGAGFDFAAASASQTRAGWSAGAGIEYAVAPHWILSAEYLHFDLGSITAVAPVTTQFNPAVTATFNFSTKVSGDIARVGAAYKF